jgi:hypothetical protein
VRSITGRTLENERIWLERMDGHKLGPIALPSTLASRCKVGWSISGIGRIAHFEASFSVPSLPTDIRFDWNLAGGATMDLGCYLLNMVHYFSGLNPQVRRADARVGPPIYVDQRAKSKLSWQLDIHLAITLKGQTC